MSNFAIATGALPPPPLGRISVQGKVPKHGVIIVARRRWHVGVTCAGKIVTVHVEEAPKRVTLVHDLHRRRT
jgi:hypothetical protein